MIYHLITHEIWEKTLNSNKPIYEPASFKTEGFIHCSFAEQIAESANLHFPEQTELVVLHIVEKRIKNIIKTEASRQGILFPHIYGELPLDAVEELSIMVRNSEGVFEWPSR